ncbi:hypothetical protein [Spirochaeta isovalerica]|uniref:Lipoprotein n=1 Tax=Spirochaeta isovalerica TaxID=150 RepID=A0A841RAU1_9SPIO|nr:hypothetical protein [Spirochaeta isovalerica]MBB6480367.1 hypothetical protein [Spirochaeta isovalerica]
MKGKFILVILIIVTGGITGCRTVGGDKPEEDQWFEIAGEGEESSG